MAAETVMAETSNVAEPAKTIGFKYKLKTDDIQSIKKNFCSDQANPIIAYKNGYVWFKYKHEKNALLLESEEPLSDVPDDAMNLLPMCMIR